MEAQELNNGILWNNLRLSLYLGCINPSANVDTRLPFSAFIDAVEFIESSNEYAS